MPVRDEESESQRKARSRLMRQSRRSTQVWDGAGAVLPGLREEGRGLELESCGSLGPFSLTEFSTLGRDLDRLEGSREGGREGSRARAACPAQPGEQGQVNWGGWTRLPVSDCAPPRQDPSRRPRVPGVENAEGPAQRGEVGFLGSRSPGSHPVSP